MRGDEKVTKGFRGVLVSTTYQDLPKRFKSYK